MNALLKKGREAVIQMSSLVHPRPREVREKAEASPLYPKSSPVEWGRCLFAQPELPGGPWCLSIRQFLLSRRELKAEEVMSHRSCVVLSLLKSSFQLVILMRPHNNPGNC